MQDAIQDAKKFSNLKNASLSEVGDLYLEQFTNTALSRNMSVGEKCTILERLNQFLRYFINGNFAYYIDVNKKALESAFKILEQMNQEDSAILHEITDAFSKYKTDVNNGKLDQFNEYLIEIFSITGLFYSSEGTFTVDENMISKYDLPSLETKRPINYMGLALISLVCLPIGLAAIFFASRVKIRFNNCNVTGAKRAARYARNIALIGILIVAIIVTIESLTNNSKGGTSSNNKIMTVQKSDVMGVKTKYLIGKTFLGYDDKKAFMDKLGFWCGSQLTYEDEKFIIERWENAKLKELWLVLLEKSNDKSIVNDYYFNYGTIRDILTYKNTTGGDMGPFQVFNNKTNEMSDYMMIQMTSENKLVKIYNIDSKRKKITEKNPESHWGDVLSEWESY